MKLLHLACLNLFHIDSVALARYLHIQKCFESAIDSGVNHLTKQQAHRLTAIGINPLALLDMEPICLPGVSPAQVANLFRKESKKSDYTHTRTGAVIAIEKRERCRCSIIQLLKDKGAVSTYAMYSDMAGLGFGRRVIDKMLGVLIDEGEVVKTREPYKITFRLKKRLEIVQARILS